MRMVQFCLAGPHEIDEMKAVLRSVADSHGLTFLDRSAETEAEAEAIAELRPGAPVARPTVNVGTPGGRPGFSAGNFPEAPNQIVVGLSKGGDELAARKLSDSVVGALGRRWSIHEVANPEATGAFPLENCDS